MLFILIFIFPVVHQPSSGGSGDDEDSWCSECAGREGGAAGVTEEGGLAVAWLMDMATFWGGVPGGDVGVASFLWAETEELRGVAEVVADVAAVVPVEASAVVLKMGVDAVILDVAVEDMSLAEGTKGLASTLRTDPPVSVGGCVIVAAKGDWLVDKAEVGRRSGVLLQGLKTELACEAGMTVSVGVDFVRAAVAREGVFVIGVVVCESGVEPGGVWRTESRKEKVWETGLRLSPVINIRLPPSPDTLLLLAALAAELLLASGFLLVTFSSFAFFRLSLGDAGKSSTHMGS